MYDQLPQNSVTWESSAASESEEQRELYAAAAALPLVRRASADLSEKGEADDGNEVGLRYQFRIAQGAALAPALLTPTQVTSQMHSLEAHAHSVRCTQHAMLNAHYPNAWALEQRDARSALSYRKRFSLTTKAQRD